MPFESHATVHQMITVVRGRLLPAADAIDCIRAAQGRYDAAQDAAQ